MKTTETKTLTEAEENELLAAFDETGIIKVRNNLEDGEYGPAGSAGHTLAHQWLEKQHRRQLDNIKDLKNEPQRLLVVVGLLAAFFGLFFYIVAY